MRSLSLGKVLYRLGTVDHDIPEVIKGQPHKEAVQRVSSLRLAILTFLHITLC